MFRRSRVGGNIEIEMTNYLSLIKGGAYSAGLLILLSLCLSCPWSFATQRKQTRPAIAKGAAMRLIGKHTFTLTSGGTANWQLDREQTDETGGGSTLVRAIASAQGATAWFDLPGVPGKETVYYINASGPGFTDTQTVQRLSGLPAERMLPEVFRLARALSPHLAAEAENITIRRRMQPIAQRHGCSFEAILLFLAPSDSTAFTNPCQRFPTDFCHRF